MSEPTQAAPPRRGAWGQVKNVKESIVWIAALVGSTVTIINALPVILQTANTTIEAIFYQGPSNLVVVASDDQPFASQYIAILAERGFKTRYASLSELSNVAKERPGVLFVSKAKFSPREKINLDEATRNRLRKHTKVVGIGSFGAYFIRELDAASMLGSVMHIKQTTAVFDDPRRPKDVGQNLAPDSLVKLYDIDTVDPMTTVAAYDSGSTAMQMTEGIARYSEGQPRDRCTGAHWSIAMQGNFALWGYQLPAAALTPQGRQLFGDLAVHMQQAPYVQPDRQFSKLVPGTLQARLGCGLTSQIYRFRPTSAGAITASVVAEAPVALILNAPYQVGYLGRQNGREPKVEFNVQQSNLDHPGDWTLTVAYFGQVKPETSFQYRLQFDYPHAPERSVIWLGASAIAAVLGLLALVRLSFMFFRRKAASTA